MEILDLKTTLARAAASMADVTFISCSGSEFVEKFVGQGAARVRKLFEKAEKIKGPCMIFIDEIDAMGKARGDSGASGGNNGSAAEAEQVLILVNCLITKCSCSVCSRGPGVPGDPGVPRGKVVE